MSGPRRSLDPAFAIAIILALIFGVVLGWQGEEYLSGVSFSLPALGQFADRLVWFWFLTDAKGAIPGLDANVISVEGQEFIRAQLFATTAALAFAVFVILETLILVLRIVNVRGRGAGSALLPGRQGEGSAPGIPWLRILLGIGIGSIAAWLVAFVTFMVGIKFNVVTALAIGVSWQVAYAQLLERFRSEAGAGSSGTDDRTPPKGGPSTGTGGQTVEIQPDESETGPAEEEDIDEDIQSDESEEPEDDPESPPGSTSGPTSENNSGRPAG